MSDAASCEVLEVSQKLLRSIDKGDWTAYAALCVAAGFVLAAHWPQAVAQFEAQAEKAKAKAKQAAAKKSSQSGQSD